MLSGVAVHWTDDAREWLWHRHPTAGPAYDEHELGPRLRSWVCRDDHRLQRADADGAELDRVLRAALASLAAEPLPDWDTEGAGVAAVLMYGSEDLLGQSASPIVWDRVVTHTLGAGGVIDALAASCRYSVYDVTLKPRLRVVPDGRVPGVVPGVLEATRIHLAWSDEDAYAAARARATELPALRGADRGKLAAAAHGDVIHALVNAKAKPSKSQSAAYAKAGGDGLAAVALELFERWLTFGGGEVGRGLVHALRHAPSREGALALARAAHAIDRAPSVDGIWELVRALRAGVATLPDFGQPGAAALVWLRDRPGLEPDLAAVATKAIRRAEKLGLALPKTPLDDLPAKLRKRLLSELDRAVRDAAEELDAIAAERVDDDFALRDAWLDEHAGAIVESLLGTLPQSADRAAVAGDLERRFREAARAGQL